MADHTILVLSGPAGPSLYLDDYRIGRRGVLVRRARSPRQPPAEPGKARPMTRDYTPLCDATNKRTGAPCQQPERWLVRYPKGRMPDGVTIRDKRVCQVHGRWLERQGWTFVRELRRDIAEAWMDRA